MTESRVSEKPVISADTLKRILAFRDDRNWKQFHNPKDLAISVSLEAAVREKIAVNDAKYPVKESYGSSAKYNELKKAVRS